MKIGIVGIGVVGSACKAGFLSQNHIVKIHDILLPTQIDDVLDTDIVYICVPTPGLPNGKCDTSRLYNVVLELSTKQYTGIVAIKSTCEPGTTKSLGELSGLQTCYVPEFLREWCAEQDFIHNHKLLAIGTSDKNIYDTVVKSHGNLPEKCVQLSESEAEILKYYNNIFNALRVTFANNMFELCQTVGANYNKVLDAYLERNTASPDYMNCTEELRGFGGMCLPKDVNGMIQFFKDAGLNLELFSAIANDNKKFKCTTKPGMRNE